MTTNITTIVDSSPVNSDSMLIKYNLATAIGRTNIANYIRKIINESQCFEFVNERAKKFFDTDRPELHLLFDIKSAIATYEDLNENLSLTNKVEIANLVHINNDDVPFEVNYLRDAKREVVTREITSRLSDFFNMTLLTIKNDGVYPENSPETFKTDVEEILKDKDIKKLQQVLTNIEKYLNNEGDEELSYQVSVISSVRFAIPSNDDTRDRLVVELLY